MAGDLSFFEEIINVYSRIEARDNTWQLPSSNVSDHVPIHILDYLGLGSGGQLLG